MTQSERVLDHLQRHGSITQMESTDLYGIMRLGARIYELKKDGVPLDKVMVEAENRYGDKVHFARYFLTD